MGLWRKSLERQASEMVCDALGQSGGGAGGIRTREELLTLTHFPGVRLQPLGHRSSPRRGSEPARQGDYHDQPFGFKRRRGDLPLA